MKAVPSLRLSHARCLARPIFCSVKQESSIAELKSKMQTWSWKDKKINYLVLNSILPFKRGMGLGSILHYRQNIPALEKTNTVYAIDLLGFGNSEKAIMKYGMNVWRDLVVDFSRQFIKEPVYIVGNSIGSLSGLLACQVLKEKVAGIVLLNSAGGMNNKHLKELEPSLRITIFLFVLGIIDFLLSIKPISKFLFDRLATKETIRSILTDLYSNKSAVDDDLVEIFYRPSQDEGALDVFVEIITGDDDCPSAIDIIKSVDVPMLVLWGTEDRLTGYNEYLSKFLQTWPKAEYISLQDTGHLLHDDRPELVNHHVLSWLDKQRQQ